jgi:hypothetical protein
MKHILPKQLRIVLGAALLSAAVLIGYMPSASALSGSSFVAGNIIDDSIFYDKSSMSPNDIQAFLNAKVPSCDTNGTQIYSGSTTRAAYSASVGYYPPFTCLRDYTQDVAAITATGDGLCTGNVDAGRKSAAQIIYDVAQACNISPKILLVVLQKEQSLVTDTWPWTTQYTKATGYGCPDSTLSADVDANHNGCYDSYEGFVNQIYYAAQGYKRYQKYPDNYNYRAGRTQAILYNPNTACGSSGIYIKNQATAALYIYTPYQPNQAALNNLYGTGDSCSAYGNRNFWRLYNDWFGPSIGPLVRTTDSGMLYYSDGVNKYSVPSMQVAAEYGLNESDVRFVPQSEIDRLQTSRPLALVIKSDSDSDADGGTLYLVSNGKRYSVNSMTQFANFGFVESDITLVPYNQLLRMPLDGSLSDFVKGPNGFVYTVESGTKKGIFDGNLFTSLDPSGAVTTLSDFSLARLTTGTALINQPLLLKSPSGDIWYARSTGWHYIGTATIAACMGYSLDQAYAFSSQQSTLGTRLGDASCLTKDGSQIYLLDKGTRYPLTTAPVDSPAVDMGSAIQSAQQTGADLSGKVIKNTVGELYVIQNGQKRYLPSMSSLNELGISESAIVSLKTGSPTSLPTGPWRYASRTVIKDGSNGKLYLVNNDSLQYISSMNLFSAYGLSSSSIVTQDGSYISKMTTGSGLSTFVQSGGQSYFIDSGKSYPIPSGITTAYASSFAQTYGGTLPQQSSVMATRYVKANNSANLYYLDAGQRHYVGSWNTFVNIGGTNQNITTYSSWALSQIPEGSPL